ncbi:MAG: metal ABC transporter permease [Bacteroidales bacterium]|jgi:zinc/manganese transport system permease protein
MVHALIIALITGLFLSYLGIHVVGRGIVFVDLAIGQISSFGGAFAAFVGVGLTTIPLVFTLIGALLISLIDIRDKRLKLEAIIGIIYAFSSAATVLLISKTPHGDSDVQEVLFGNILSVNISQITVAGIVFGVLALLHIIFRKKFFQLTNSYETNSFNTKSFNIWNFLFYISIGLSIVFAVKISGVIPVFSYLIIPPVCAIMLTRSNKILFIIAMLVSFFGSFFGLFVSFHFDFPAGSSIVAVLGCIFLLVSIVPLTKYFFPKKDKAVS